MSVQFVNMRIFFTFTYFRRYSKNAYPTKKNAHLQFNVNIACISYIYTTLIHNTCIQNKGPVIYSERGRGATKLSGEVLVKFCP